MIYGIPENHWLVIKDNGVIKYLCRRRDYGASSSYNVKIPDSDKYCHCPACREPLCKHNTWPTGWGAMPINSVIKSNCKKCNAILVMVNE